jgi:hypothetical protein
MNELSGTAPAKDGRTVSRLIWFHERFGKPQVYALLLLMAFSAQCLWLAGKTPLRDSEMAHVITAQSSSGHAVSPEHSGPLSPVVTALARAGMKLTDPARQKLSLMMLRLPFIIIGGLLGASVWYVSRRLYGNAGGYTALALYAFSPAVIQRWAAVAPDVIAAWGTFGCIFTGIAVAHTLYAPREVVLWNWRRIILLGIAIGLGVTAVPSTAFAVPIALLFMFYLVPHRGGAALGILSAACVLGFIVVLATFSFSWSAMVSFLHTSGGLHLTSAPMSRGVAAALVGGFVVRNGPAFTTLLAMSVGVWLGWRRTRFFGTTAPLIVAAVLVFVGVMLAHRDVLVFLEIVLPFLFVFVAGVCADLLELKSTYAGLVKALILATIVSNALFSISGLLRL